MCLSVSNTKTDVLATLHQYSVGWPIEYRLFGGDRRATFGGQNKSARVCKLFTLVSGWFYVWRVCGSNKRKAVLTLLIW